MSSTAVNPHLQSQSYSFIPKLLKDELSGLRTAVQMATKAEKNCPLAQKPARTAEREMLEMELGRLRTKIERGEREAKERDVLARAKKEENEKRKEGKGAWYMKRSESFHSSLSGCTSAPLVLGWLDPRRTPMLTFQTSKRTYCSKLDSRTWSNKVVTELSRRLWRRRGRRRQARRKRVGHLRGVRQGE